MCVRVRADALAGAGSRTCGCTGVRACACMHELLLYYMITCAGVVCARVYARTYVYVYVHSKVYAYVCAGASA